MTTTRTPDVINGLTTNWLPLTTPGPDPSLLALCSSAIYYLPGAVSGLIAFDPYYGQWIEREVQCVAKEQTAWWNQHSDGVTTDINLGPFNCPRGYTTATVSSVNSLTSFVGCCPSYYDFLGTLLPAATLGQCHSSVAVGQTITALSTDASVGRWVNTTATVISEGLSVVGVHINGFVFNTGVASTSPASVSAYTTASSAPTVTSIFASNTLVGTSAATNTLVTSNSPELSSGAKIGIAVGISLAALGIICLAISIILLKRRSRPSPNAYLAGISEVPGYPSKNEEAVFYEAPAESKKVSNEPVEMWVAPYQGG